MSQDFNTDLARRFRGVPIARGMLARSAAGPGKYLYTVEAARHASLLPEVQPEAPAADVLDRLEAAGDGWGQREAARQERAFQRRLYLNWDRLVEGHADALEAGSAGVAAVFLDAAVKARMACIAAQKSNPLRRHNLAARLDDIRRTKTCHKGEEEDQGGCGG